MDDAEEVKVGREATVEELSAAQRKERLQLKADAEVMISLTRHPGWATYMRMLESIGNNFNQKVMKPIENSFESVRVEYAKGALTGISAAASMPSAKIKEARELGLLDAGE